MIKIQKKDIIAPIVITLGAFFINVFLRFKEIDNFSQKKYIFSSFDSFYYAFLSKLLINDKYTPINYFWNVPDYTINLFPPPLISLIPVYLYKMFNIDSNLIYLFMPPILGSLFVIPLYFWVRDFFKNNYFIFIGGALIGGLNLIYYARTSLGRVDTDALILFFVFLIVYLLNKTVVSKNFQSYLYLVLATVTFYVFMWWYFKPIFMLFFLLSLFIGLIIYRKNRKEIVYKILLFILLTNPVYFFSSLLPSIFHYIKTYILKISENSFILPITVSKEITELTGISLAEFIDFTTNNIIILILAITGIFLLFKTNKNIYLSLPFIVIGLLSFFGGNRFLIYISPFIGMGLGYITYQIYNFANKKLTSNLLVKFIYSILIISLVFFSIPPNTVKANIKPIFRENIYEDLETISKIEKMPLDSFIMSWWSYGGLLTYFFERGTYVSNSSMDSIKLFAIANILMSNNERDALNIISFLTNNKKIFYQSYIKTPEDFLNASLKYSKPPKNNVYLFLFPGMLTNKVIYTYGTYSVKNNQKSGVDLFFKCLPKLENIFDCGVIEYNSFSGYIKFKNKKFKNQYLKDILIIRKNVFPKLIQKKIFNENGTKTIEIIETKKDVYIIVANKIFINSILNKMFALESNFKHFKLIYSDFPYIIVYKVER